MKPEHPAGGEWTEHEPVRILWVIASPGGGGADEATELRLLAGAIDRRRYRIDAVVCCAPEDMPGSALRQLAASGVAVDRTPGRLSSEHSVGHLAGRLPSYDIVVSGENHSDVRAALGRLHRRPLLIERGGTSARLVRSGEGAAGAQDMAVAIPPMVAPCDLHDGESRATCSPAAAVRQWQALFAAVLAERERPAPATPLFRSFFQGGFECSTHRRVRDRRRLDVIASSQHDVHAESDYRALQKHGILTVRDGLRWHLIEPTPGAYDWSSLEMQLAAAGATGTEVIWDILHYGWPDDLDIWGTAFVARFAAFAAAAAARIAPRSPGRRFYTPVNEISFLAWGGGDVGYLNPFGRDRGFELKCQLARASIAAMDAIRAVDPEARFVHAEPVMHYAIDPDRPDDAEDAEGRRQSQFQAWDLIEGRLWPQVGGRRDLLDVVGVNYYHTNQKIHGGPPIDVGHPLYRPLREMLAETHARYGRPIFVSETGIEDDRRPAWLRYVAAEVRAAMRMGVPVEGVCLYPVLDHPGWDNERYCHNGLLRHSPDAAGRTAFEPLAAALLAERRALATVRPEPATG